MDSIWMAVSPGPRSTRVLAMDGPRETILKAELLRDPAHPRALGTLLEAVALWQGAQVRAALCADEQRPSCDSTLYRAAFVDHGAPLYTVAWVPAPARKRHRRGLAAGEFRDIQRVLLDEVAR